MTRKQKKVNQIWVAENKNVTYHRHVNQTGVIGQGKMWECKEKERF